jgi:hypothetical protein
MGFMFLPFLATMLIEQTYPAPIGGVTQMPPHLRGPAQVSEAINTFPSLLEGLGVRRGTALVSTFPVERDPSSSHTIDWSPDTTGRFWVTIGSSGIAVTDISTGETFIPESGQHWDEVIGSEEDTFSAYEGAFYGSVVDPNSFTSTVVGDTVYIAVKNYSKIRWAAAQSPVQPATAFVRIEAVAFDVWHKFALDGIAVDMVGSPFNFTTPGYVATVLEFLAREIPELDSKYIFESLPDVDGLLKITRRDQNDQSPINLSTGMLPQWMTVISNVVPSADRLPDTAPEGVVIRVAGLSSTSVDDYWVQRTNGRWVECVAPGSNTTIDPYLMPWALKLTGRIEGIPGFKFGPIRWTDRKSGDDDSNPIPVVENIDTIFSVEQRLGFTSGTTIVLSESNNPLSFFRTTVTQLLPSDPVNIRSTVGPNAPYHAFVSWDNSTYLWSNQAQVELRGEPVITPTTIALSLESRFESDARVSPVVVGSRIYYARGVNGYTRLYEYWRPPGFNMPPRADEVTEMVPTYLVGNPVRIVVDDSLGFLGVMTDASDSTLYVCHFTRDGNGQIQPRWHTWRFDGCAIYAMRMMQGRLHMLTEREDGTLYVEALDVANAADFQSDLPYDLDTVPVEPEVTMDGFFIRDREGAITQQRWIIRNLTLDHLRSYKGRVENVDDQVTLVNLRRQPLSTTGKIRIPLHRRHDRLTLRLSWYGFLTSLHLQGSIMDRSQRVRT